MFVYHRSAITVLLPLVLLLAVAWWSNRSPPLAAEPRLEAQKAVNEAPREVTADRDPVRVDSGVAGSRT